MPKIFQTVVKRLQQIVGSASGLIASQPKVGIALSADEQTILAVQQQAGVELSADEQNIIAAPLDAGIAVDVQGAQLQASDAVAAGIETQLNRVNLAPEELDAGVALSADQQSIIALPQHAGVALQTQGAEFNAGRESVGAGISQNAVIKELKTNKFPAFKHTRISGSVVQLTGCASVVEVNGPCGRSDFDTPSNVQGKHDGSVAVCAGATLGARCGRLNGTFPAPFGKDVFTITQVLLRFYYAQTSVLAASCSGGYVFDGGGDTQLFSHGALASVDFLTTPNEFDVTSVIDNDWSNAPLLKPYLIADVGALALGDQVSSDAFEIEITGSFDEPIT